MCKTQDDMFTTFTDVFKSAIDKHTPLKTKIIEGKQAPFVTKASSKAIIIAAREQTWWVPENYAD